jgi:small redox-active disulfide protein 2
MEIEILGGGCANCRALEALVKEAVAELGVTATVTEVTDYAAIASRGVMATPALVVDGEVLLSGRVPDRTEVTRLLANPTG